MAGDAAASASPKQMFLRVAFHVNVRRGDRIKLLEVPYFHVTPGPLFIQQDVYGTAGVVLMQSCSFSDLGSQQSESSCMFMIREGSGQLVYSSKKYDMQDNALAEDPPIVSPVGLRVSRVRDYRYSKPLHFYLS